MKTSTPTFLDYLYQEDPDLGAAAEQLLLDMWTALATELGYSWQRIEQIEAIARPRERALKREQEEAENNANDLIIREERKYA
jgi:hypothetical protein